MSEDHTETMGDMFDRGLKLRREVLCAEYVDNSLKSANEFMMAFQHITTEWCWGYAWGRPGLDKKTRSTFTSWVSNICESLPNRSWSAVP
jgi:4-carboxymuconolactone decarboxylase